MADLSPASPEDTTLRFFTAWFCPFAQRARIALMAKGVPFEEVECDIYYPDEGGSGRGLHSFPIPLNLSLLCPFPLNLSLLCPPYTAN